MSENDMAENRVGSCINKRVSYTKKRFVSDQ